MNIVFDYSTININVIQSLTDGINSVNVAINKCSQMVVPSGFEDAYFLNNLGSELSSISNSLNGIKDYLYSSNQDYERLLTDLNAQINNISNIMIDRQERKVN